MIDQRFLYSHVTGRPDTGPRGGHTDTPIRTDETDILDHILTQVLTHDFDQHTDHDIHDRHDFHDRHDCDHTVPGTATIRAARHEGERCPD